MKNKQELNQGRRAFLRRLGMGAGAAVAMTMMEPLQMFAQKKEKEGGAVNRMTYRVQHGSGEQISLLGFGMMRLPDNQDEVNALVDYAIEHGVNYFDTAPMYMGGRSEVLTGNALSRHPREKYYVATKMSNQRNNLWDFDKAKRMYEQSFERLKVDKIDYYLLHSIGGGGMDTLKGRFLDNGLLDFLMKEREAGRIKHLGFSYHGDVRVFDWVLDHQSEYHWDFAQIQMNFLDWRHASSGRRHDADAEYLYNKCEKTGVQCVVMEPLRGGAFGRMAQELVDKLKAVRPNDSAARWAFRWVGSYPNILTTLSGMNRMDHLIACLVLMAWIFQATLPITTMRYITTCCRCRIKRQLTLWRRSNSLPMECVKHCPMQRSGHVVVRTARSACRSVRNRLEYPINWPVL